MPIKHATCWRVVTFLLRLALGGSSSSSASTFRADDGEVKSALNAYTMTMSRMIRWSENVP
jgi:hypothetical protein